MNKKILMMDGKKGNGLYKELLRLRRNEELLLFHMIKNKNHDEIILEVAEKINIPINRLKYILRKWKKWGVYDYNPPYHFMAGYLKVDELPFGSIYKRTTIIVIDKETKEIIHECELNKFNIINRNNRIYTNPNSDQSILIDKMKQMLLEHKIAFNGSITHLIDEISKITYPSTPQFNIDKLQCCNFYGEFGHPIQNKEDNKHE